MSKPTQPKRIYGCSDAQMFEHSRVIHGHFVADLADFTAFDPDLDADYGDTFLDSIETAENFSSDDQIIDAVAQHTIEVENKMKECRDCFQFMKYFIEKTFPAQTSVWNEFGYNDYNKSRKSQSEMIQFMLNLFETATKYSAQLIAQNFTAPKIAEIQTLATELQNLNTIQEMAKGSRNTSSYNRVMLLNICWQINLNIRKAAKACYMNNWGKWQLYLLPWGGDGGGSEPEPEEVEGSIFYGTTVNVLLTDLQPSSVLTLNNTGTVDLRFCGGDIPNTDCGSTGIIVSAGDSIAVTLSEISPMGITPSVLNISHTVALPGSGVGQYMVSKI